MSGLWDRKGVPKKNWRCVGVEDLGEPAMTCEMCQSVTIRYVHTMEHDDYANLLQVGCICAEHMENDYVNPAERDRALMKRATRRRKWCTRNWYETNTGWRLTLKGVVYLVAPVGGSRWRAALCEPTELDEDDLEDDDYGAPKVWRNLPARFDTMNEAKLALFDFKWPAQINLSRRGRA
jgi:hypothetical protein